MIELRAATGDDVGYMWRMLYYASYSDREEGTSLEDIQANPDLTRHLTGWGDRAGDIGLVALDRTGIEAVPVGAAWIRRLIGDEQDDVTFVDADTPELVIAVEPDVIGRGAGSRLMTRILQLADDAGVAQIVLTARATNPAVPLYERYGFATIERITNRVGTESVKMLRLRRL